MIEHNPKIINDIIKHEQKYIITDDISVKKIDRYEQFEDKSYDRTDNIVYSEPKAFVKKITRR